MIQINGKTAMIVCKEDLKNSYVSGSSYNTPIATAITRETGRNCYVNRMGFVCDMWICFAVVNPAIFRLMKEWEDGRGLRPFIFDIHFVKEFDAYPGGVITKVVKHEGKAMSVLRSAHKRPFTIKRLVSLDSKYYGGRCMSMEGVN